MTHTIKDVLYVPKIEKNLISIRQSTEKGIRVIFEEGGTRVVFLRGDYVILDGMKNNNLCRLNVSTITTDKAMVVTTASLKLWHERMGHVNYQMLRKMREKGVVDDLQFNTSPENPFCEECAYGKQHRQPFKGTGERWRIPGEIFHAELCGKMSESSLGGANWFLLLKDDCTRYCFGYSLKDKTEVLQFIQEFYAEVQADGHQIRQLRSECGLEFCNDEVKSFLLSRGSSTELPPHELQSRMVL